MQYSIPDPSFYLLQQGHPHHHPYQQQSHRHWNHQAHPQYYKTENIYSVEYKKSSLTMLWNQTKQLPKEAFNMVEQKYIELGFSLEVRLQLPVFVESNFMPNVEVDEATAVNLATQLLSQLEAKIAAIPNEPDKYMSKTKLQEMYDELKVSVIS